MLLIFRKLKIFWGFKENPSSNSSARIKTLSFCLIDKFLNFKFLFKGFPELLTLVNSIEWIVRTCLSTLLIKLPGKKTKIIRNKKNIQLVILKEIEEILKKFFMVYKFEKILLLKALINRYRPTHKTAFSKKLVIKIT